MEQGAERPDRRMGVTCWRGWVGGLNVVRVKQGENQTTEGVFVRLGTNSF